MISRSGKCGELDELSGARCELNVVGHWVHEHTVDGVTVQWYTQKRGSVTLVEPLLDQEPRPREGEH